MRYFFVIPRRNLQWTQILLKKISQLIIHFIKNTVLKAKTLVYAGLIKSGPWCPSRNIFNESLRLVSCQYHQVKCVFKIAFAMSLSGCIEQLFIRNKNNILTNSFAVIESVLVESLTKQVIANNFNNRNFIPRKK